MATNPKIKPCPRCKTDDSVGVWDYDGTKHVECVACDYLGPASGSVRWAIKLYNQEATQRASA